MHSGPLDALICVIGEAPGVEEERARVPFIGLSGRELTKMLGEAGIARESCLILNVCNERPANNEIESFFYSKTEAKLLGREALLGRFPNDAILRGRDEALTLIAQYPRNLILALGDTALWALTGLEGVTKWRGSLLESLAGPKLIPTFHPVSVLHTWVQRPIAIQDMRRAAREARHPKIRKPEYKFTIRPTKASVINLLETLLLEGAPITVDIETRDNQIACIGLGWSDTAALCIPFIRVGGNGNYWEFKADELEIILLLREVLTKLPCIFHNALFDCQYIARQWGFMPRIAGDTMFMQHVAFPALMGGKIDSTTGKTSKKGSSNSLVFIASMYCAYYRHWKDDGRLWDPAIHDEDVYWIYNCEDCVRTYECWQVLTGVLEKASLSEPYAFELSLFQPVFSMMFRGIHVDLGMRNELHIQLNTEMDEIQSWLDTAIGHRADPWSAPQMQDLFYGDLKVQPILNRKTKRPTLDDKALETIAKRTPLLEPLISRIQRIRTLRTIDSTFLQASLSRDNRLRCAFNIASAETYRFTSNETAFGEGCNMQNVPKPIEEN